jgi:hypothetical protein
LVVMGMIPSLDARPVWQKPVMITMVPAAGAKGDPTISDDGLGDGLFSP